jgi:tagatose-1,6-bisphosphate aldolase
MKLETIEDVDLYLAEKEGLKEQVSIAQIKELRVHFATMLTEYPEALILVLQNGVKHLKKEDSSGC